MGFCFFFRADWIGLVDAGVALLGVRGLRVWRSLELWRDGEVECFGTPR